jgi:hypothetical protein
MPPYSPAAAPSSQFGNPVHCVKIAKDGLVYICDRMNNRIQVFRKDGTFVKEFIIEKNTLRAGSVWDLDFWIDPQQTYLLNADGTNNEVRTLRRETGEIVGAFGRNGRNAGRSPKGHQRSLRDVAAELAKLGYVNERGSEFSASSIASMIEARPSAPRGMK